MAKKAAKKKTTKKVAKKVPEDVDPQEEAVQQTSSYRVRPPSWRDVQRSRKIREQR